MKKQSVAVSKLGKVSLKSDMRMNWRVYLLILPIIIYFIVFNYLPMFGLVMSFQDFNPVKGFFHSDFVGLKNFIEFFSAPNFWQLMRNTLVISLLGLVIGTPVTIGFALLLNEVSRMFFKRTVQTISYMPYFVSLVVICGLVIEFCGSNGVITQFLVNVFGIKQQNLLQNPNYFWGIYLVSDLWQGVGYGSIIYIAAITSVSSELHEAAAIDGAGRLKRVFNVTIPAIMPTIVTLVILKCGMMFSTGFEKVLLLYNPSIYETADVISTYVQRMGIIKQQYGFSAAVGLFNSLVNTILLLVSNYLSKKYTDNSIV